MGRLKEKNDPQISDIMRTIDDNIISEFIENFKGCAMTIDAVLYHLGTNLKMKSNAVLNEVNKPTLLSSNNSTMCHSINNDHLDTTTHSSNDIYDNIHAPTPAAPLHMYMDEYENDINFDDEKNSVRILHSPVATSMYPRRDESIKVVPRPMKSMGAGFRSTAKPKSRQSGNPNYNMDIDGFNPFDDINYESSVRQGSQSATSRPLSPSNKAISVMRNQLSGEKSLLSEQPDITLSSAQLDALAAGTTSFDNIATSSFVDSDSHLSLGEDEHFNRKKHKQKVELANTSPPFLKSNMSSSETELLRLKENKTKVSKRSNNKKILSKFRALQSRDYDGLYVTTSIKPSVDGE